MATYSHPIRPGIRIDGTLEWAPWYLAVASPLVTFNTDPHVPTLPMGIYCATKEEAVAQMALFRMQGAKYRLMRWDDEAGSWRIVQL